jgi:hypothetical protein
MEMTKDIRNKALFALENKEELYVPNKYIILEILYILF